MTINMGEKLSFMDTALSVYSQHQEIYGFISPENPLYKRLKKSIEEEGLKKYKYNLYEKTYVLLKKY